MRKRDSLSLELDDYDRKENIPANKREKKGNSLSLELDDYDHKEVPVNKMKKKRDLLSLGLYDYNRKANIPGHKKAKMVSLSLSDHCLESSVPCPPQPHSHKKLRLFGFDISIDENVNPNSPRTNKQPQSSSNPNLEKPFRVIFDQSAGPTGVQKKSISIPSKGKSRLYEQGTNSHHHHHHHHHQELLHPNSTETQNLEKPQSFSNPNLEKPSRVTFDQSAGPSAVQKQNKSKPSNGKSRLYEQDHHHHHQELLSPAILEHIQSNGGTRPVFLFQKQLTGSDTRQGQNRLFLSRRTDTIMREMMNLLTEFERHEVHRERDLEVVTIDPKGDYFNLKLRWWMSLRMLVLKTEWFKLVKANQLEKDDLVQLWGYRQDSRFRLALKISRKDRRGGGSTDDGSGPSTVSTA